MKMYLVGGAVRDRLLKRTVKERDWVVVGSTPEAMLALNYQPVGKEFPVFLHPVTKEEYALARTEKKVGKGYKGFTFYTSPEVTLEQDLMRRDLTINAIAEDEHGNLIDPYHGRQDLEKKKLRHVSPAFSEDPVRILRLARFAAKLPEFVVDPNTLQLMQHMVANGEVDALVAERVWQECAKALQEQAPWRFFEILHACGAAQVLWPELTLSEQRLQTLRRAADLTPLATVRLAALWWGVDAARFVKRFKVPKEYRGMLGWSDVLRPTSDGYLDFLEKGDAFRRPQRFEQFLLLRLAVSAHSDETQLENQCLLKALKAAKGVDVQQLSQQNLAGPEFALQLRQLRLAAIKQAL